MATFMYLDPDFLQRQDSVNMSALPKQCCAKCSEWVGPKEIDVDLEPQRLGIHTPTKKVVGCGQCCKYSTNDWDAFTWADDCCDRFYPDEEV